MILAPVFAPVRVQAEAPRDIGDYIVSEAAALIDGDTGQVLFNKNMHKKMGPASITKIMTALVALENSGLDDVITISHDAVFSIGRGTSHIALDVGEEILMEHALYALAIASANDAANGIAEHVGGTMQGFTALMNERAAKAGAYNTNFINAHGLSDSNHYTTAYDMAMIAMAAIKTPHFCKMFGTVKYEMPPTNKQSEKRIFNSRNAMLAGNYKYDGFIAGKTGWTSDTGHTLVTAAKKGGRTLIAVVMMSSASRDKWEDSTALLNYGFREFAEARFTPEDFPVFYLPIKDAEGNDSDVIISSGEEFKRLVPKPYTKDDVEIRYELANGGAADELIIKTVFTLRVPATLAFMADLGEMAMSLSLSGSLIGAGGLEPAAPEETQTNDSPQKGGTALRIILTVFIIFVSLILGALVILSIRRIIIIRKRRQTRKIDYYIGERKMVK